MAVDIWRPGYAINFTAQGDKTFEAIYKACIMEIEKIYGHLNLIRNQFQSDGAIKAMGEVASEEELPPTGNVGDAYLVSNDSGIFLYVWNGSMWKKLSFSGLSAANVDNPGLVRIADLDDILNDITSNVAVVTEWVLQQFGWASGLAVAPGVVVPWYGAPNAVPVGWALCNGANGTPDYRNRFLRGVVSYDAAHELTTGGIDTNVIQDFPLPVHNHPFSVPVNLANHTHTVSGTSTSGTFSHAHTFSGSVTNISTAGEHSHVIETITYSIGDTLPKAPSAGTFRYLYRRGNGSLYVPPAGGHTHTYTNTGAISIPSHTFSHAHTIAISTGTSSAYNISISGTTGSATKSASLSISNRPAYKTLAYIMKL